MRALKTKLLFFLVGLSPFTISIGRADLSTTSGTLIHSLDGLWQSARDIDNEGIRKKWFESAHFPQADARTAQVPGSGTETWPISSWWTDAPTNILWYTRTFSLKTLPARGAKYYLRFGAVKRLSQVWINGVSLGTHEGGEDPFEFDVTSLLVADRPNTVVVRLQMAMLGGMNQHVALVSQPAVRIVDAFARPDAKRAALFST